MTIILEISKYFGKDLNVVVAYELFKKVNEKKVSDTKLDKKGGEKDCKYTHNQMRNMFIVALQNLKYMGFFSASRASAFAFKKNFFGKPELATELLSVQNKNNAQIGGGSGGIGGIGGGEEKENSDI
jgi:hypothetical protein